MKKNMFFIIVVIFLVLFQGKLFSAISSRVEGVVTDDSGQGLKEAHIALFAIQADWGGTAKQVIIREILRTDVRGYFKFDDVESGDYFLSILKEGYAAFGPIHAFAVDRWEDFDHDRLDWKKIKGFHLKEGQIKHFKMQLQKEAVLKINILRKTPNGTEPVQKHVGLYPISIIHDAYANNFTETIANELIVPFFKEGNAIVEINYQGEMDQLHEIRLENGKTSVLDLVFDFTSGQVVHGIIKDKQTGETVFGASISLYNLNVPGKSYHTISEDRGEFWIGGVTPGIYKLYVYEILNLGEMNEREGRYSIQFTISINESKSLNIEL